MGGHLFLLGSLSKNNELRQKEDAVQILKDSFINNAVLIKQFCVALDSFFFLFNFLIILLNKKIMEKFILLMIV